MKEVDKAIVQYALNKTITELNGIDLDDMSKHWASEVPACDLETVAQKLAHHINEGLKL